MVPSADCELSSFFDFDGAAVDADRGLLLMLGPEDVESRGPPIAVAMRSAEGVGKGIVLSGNSQSE